jgi:hypothetical protein
MEGLHKPIKVSFTVDVEIEESPQRLHKPASAQIVVMNHFIGFGLLVFATALSSAHTLHPGLPAG